MKIDIKIDAFIYNDKSERLNESRNYIAESVLDNETKEYYNRIIQTKFAYENILEQRMKFLFHEYFFNGFTLKELPHLYNLSKDEIRLPKSIIGQRRILATACFRFIAIAEICPDMNIGKFDTLVLDTLLCYALKIVNPYRAQAKLYEDFLLFDTAKHNIHYILDSKKEGKELFERIYWRIKDYEKLMGRVAAEDYKEFFDNAKRSVGAR